MAFATRYRAALSGGVLLLVTALALFAVHSLLAEVRLDHVRAALSALGWGQVAAALLFTAGSYLALTCYDVLALRVIARTVPYRVAALASFTSYTLSHNLGLSLLTGGSARYRIYTAAGLSGGDVARVIANATLTFWSGIAALSGIGLLLWPVPLHLAGVEIGAGVQRAIGVVLLGAIVALVAFAGRRRSVGVFGWRVALPTRRQAVAMILVSACDVGLASAALFVLVPGLAWGGFPAFFVGYALAIVIAAISHAPGGIGVFEAVILLALPQVDRSGLAAALLAYRACYYLLPLVVAAVMMAWREGRRFHAPLDRLATDVAVAGRSVMHTVAPAFIATLVFTGGVMLLVSGALPALPGRLRDLAQVVPLPFVEASHIAASLVGTLLLFLAPGLYRRLDGAFIATRALLAAGVVFSLAKGIDYEEAGVLLALLGVLQWSRGAFYRRTAFTGDLLSPGWLAATGSAILLALWIGLFAFKHVEYRSALWWDFAWRGDASRFLRASLAVSVLAVAMMLRRLLLAPAPPPAAVALTGAALHAALATTDHSDAMLALTGDKRFLVAETGDAFLAYQVQGRTWIAMGDPVGPRAAWPDLMWRLRGLADAAQGRLLFYQIGPEALPVAIDLGFAIVKYGEEARVPLAGFTLAGPAGKPLRHAERRAEKAGAVFEIVPAAAVPALLPALEAVSDEWLAAKGRSEKAFSLGRFDSDYLSRFDCAVVREGERITAFANLWATPNRTELSVDLMRHRDALSYSAMDLLFARLMVWGRDQGYARFSLGLAPLSGLDARRLAPLWAQAANLVYRRGEGLYGFEGLRFYKQKFQPEWTPRYIAANGDLALARGLFDLNRLISGGRGSSAWMADRCDPLPGFPGAAIAT
ncbi:bifunctional lysylphosphatidylglycerol flippase/synthetase MprF [Sphingomonas solaris]|uniref:Bifunctional lysylphosphatidylglycerol flippase/synthetase MprF n=2 Tax=Alterirhizorhabdus solaris TaxID=2529389 RepID=A0A558QUJ8_9SPHN|nr:bifunctional lysylphosphatidylglycerol flippase/synthetase MprF [Sphingomonas solaris]